MRYITKRKQISASQDGHKTINELNKIKYECEIEFVKTFFIHDEWIYHPCAFKLKGTTYEPDFYDKRRNVFIEVVGSRQAFHQNKKKYLQFISCYPNLGFEIRKTNGQVMPIKRINKRPKILKLG